MSSIVTAVFKATIGLLVNKGRDKAAEKLKDGDVADQKFRGLIVREIDDIKSKLDGLSRKDLLASMSFFKEGIELLYEVFDKARSRSENSTVTTQAACAEEFSLAKVMSKLEVTSLDESATRALSKAKKRFEDARRKATEAFNNEALKTADRILAMQYRVMATILETVDNPADALGTCRVCIEELHGLSAVQESFNVELIKGFRARFGKDERTKIICNVCHVNFVIYHVTLVVCFGNKELSDWPYISSGENKVDPLHDERIAEILRKQDMEHCCVPWSFGQDGNAERRLHYSLGIATNSSGQFIVADRGDSHIKIFDSNGHFTNRFSVPNDEVDTKLYICDVATDTDSNIYVLVDLWKPGTMVSQRALVYKLNSNTDLHQNFPVRGGGVGYWGRLTVIDDCKVLVLKSWETDVIHVYKSDGQFVRAIGKGIFKCACDITAANDGCAIVLDSNDSCVYIFSKEGDHLNKFELGGFYSRPSIAFHQASEHVVVAGLKQGICGLHVEIYTKDGKFVRSTQIHEEGISNLVRMTVTMEGRIAATYERKIVVL